MRLRRELDLDSVAGAELAALPHDGHDSRLAEELPVGFSLERRVHQAVADSFQLDARIAQARHLDHCVLPKREVRTGGEAKEIDSPRRDVLAHYARADLVACGSKLVVELPVDEVDLPQIRGRGIPAHPGAVLHRLARVSIALDAEPCDEAGRRLAPLRERVAGASAHGDDDGLQAAIVPGRTIARVIPRAFGESQPFSLGAEEEIFVVDAGTYAPVAVPEDAFAGERRKPELFASVVELTTDVCGDAGEIGSELGRLRAEARTALAYNGLALAATATWPPASPEDQAITPDAGYLRFVEFAGTSARRQFCSGLHLHVGVESAEQCMVALEFVLPWLPVLLAVSANSPYLAGLESGLRSTRAEILAYLPRAGAPPVFESYADWERFATRIVHLELADDYRRIWWDVRPHPGFGTLELRAPDQPTDVQASAAFAAVAQALVASARPGPRADRGVYAENRWAASRFGRDARLIHPNGDRLATVPELLDELVDLVGPRAEELGGHAALGALRDLDGAGRQLELGRRDGIDAVCADLVART